MVPRMHETVKMKLYCPCVLIIGLVLQLKYSEMLFITSIIRNKSVKQIETPSKEKIGIL